jgi:hypothetical protein
LEEPAPNVYSPSDLDFPTGTALCKIDIPQRHPVNPRNTSTPLCVLGENLLSVAKPFRIRNVQAQLE